MLDFQTFIEACGCWRRRGLVLFVPACLVGTAAVSQMARPELKVIPTFVVTVATDDATGVAANCTGAGTANCSLRDAVAAAAAAGAANIAFDPGVFGASQTAAARTINIVHGSLSISSSTTITGLTSGSGATLTNLVTVSGGQTCSIFAVASGITGVVLSDLAISGGGSGVPPYSCSEGGNILNDGGLTLTGVSVSGGQANSGNGIFNDTAGTLTIVNSSVNGNSTNSPDDGSNGGGIYNQGKLSLVNTIVTYNNGYVGAGILNAAGGALTVADSTITENVNYSYYEYAGQGAGIANQGAWLAVSNTLLANNQSISGETHSPGSEDDCFGAECPTNGTNGNVVGAGLDSILPGSAAVCGGVSANIPAGVTTDERGLPRTTVYSTSSGTVSCVDAGAIETHYELNFTQQPPASVGTNLVFAAAVQLTESGVVLPDFTYYFYPISLSLAAGDSGQLSDGLATTNANGVATYTDLLVNAAGSGDMLVASVPVTGSLSTPLAVYGASSKFDVTSVNAVQVTIGASAAGPTFTVDGTAYSAPVTLGWLVGSQHTIATTSPQTVNGVIFRFLSWSDGGAISHTVTAETNTTYTAKFFDTAAPVVNTNSDDAVGTAANCDLGSQAVCTLRDALAAAAQYGKGTITFDANVFAASKPVAARTITLTNYALGVPQNTTIQGLTAGTGATLTNLVTIDGNNQDSVFTAYGGAIVISGLTIIHGAGEAAIASAGSLTISQCTISASNVGIYNDEGGALLLLDSTVSGNGTGLEDEPQEEQGEPATTTTIIGSTFSGNAAAALAITSNLVVDDSTIANNAGGGISYLGAPPASLANNIFTGNGQEDDCNYDGCPQVAPLGNYGGPTQTQPPLPGSTAICAGAVGSIPAGVTTDQRGLPRTTSYGSTRCLDTGAVETHYSLSFAEQPPASVGVNAGFAAAVQIDESGSPFPAAGIVVPLSLGMGDNGTLSGNTASTSANGLATYSQLKVSAEGAYDRLVATLPVSTNPPPSPLTEAISVSQASGLFDVGIAAPAAPGFSLMGGTYPGPQSVKLSDATMGASLYYTTDGSTPGAGSTPYTVPINVAVSETVKAIAILDGLSSAVTSEMFTIGSSQCQTIDYSKGFTSAGLTLNSGAAVKGGLLELTDGGFYEARSAFSSQLVPVTSYTTDFTFQLVNPLADGITFTIQSTSPRQVGQVGGGLGYAGIANSAAIKFDLFNNNGEGFDSTGLYLDGAYPSTPALDLSGAGIYLHSGHVFAVHIAYSNEYGTATITDTATGKTASASLSGDLSKIVGDQAYVGFTGGSGLLTATQNILTWSFAGCGGH